MSEDLADLVARFRKVALASVSDAVEQVCGKRGYLDHGIRSMINDKRIVGPAVTVLEGRSDEAVPPQLALDLIDQSPAGSVMVISAGGECDVAVWGGLMTAGAVANGFEGAVLDAGVRDVIEIKRDYDFPVFARSVSPGSTVGRFKTLMAQVPVPIGPVMVHPGDIVVADPEGVVIVPRERAREVVAVVEEIDSRELEQAKMIIAEKSINKGLAKYGRI